MNRKLTRAHVRFLFPLVLIDSGNELLAASRGSSLGTVSWHQFSRQYSHIQIYERSLVATNVLYTEQQILLTRLLSLTYFNAAKILAGGGKAAAQALRPHKHDEGAT